MRLISEKKFEDYGTYYIWTDTRVECIGNDLELFEFLDGWNSVYKYESLGAVIDNHNDYATIVEWDKQKVYLFKNSTYCVNLFNLITRQESIFLSVDKHNIPFLFFTEKKIFKNELIAFIKRDSHMENQETLLLFNHKIRKYIFEINLNSGYFEFIYDEYLFFFSNSNFNKKINLQCFDIFKGQQEIWHYDFELEGFEVLKNDPPLQYTDMLLFMVRGKEGPSTLAIDTQTGKKRWYCEMGHLPDVSCTYQGNLVSYRGIWYNDVVLINPQTGEITEHWQLPDWVNDYPVDHRGNFTIDEQYLYIAPKNYVGLDHEYYEGKGVLVFSLETHELVQELPCLINLQCKKIEKVGKRLFVHDHGNLHIFVEE